MEAKSRLYEATFKAYTAVMALGFTHQMLVSRFFGVNFNTLKRIMKGQSGRRETDRFYLKLFLSILNEKYDAYIGSADTTHAVGILKMIKDITLTEHGIDTKKNA